MALWLLYGLALGEWPIIIANLVTLALAFTILVRTWRARTVAAGLIKSTLDRPTST